MHGRARAYYDVAVKLASRVPRGAAGGGILALDVLVRLGPFNIFWDSEQEGCHHSGGANLAQAWKGWHPGLPIRTFRYCPCTASG